MLLKLILKASGFPRFQTFVTRLAFCIRNVNNTFTGAPRYRTIARGHYIIRDLSPRAKECRRMHLSPSIRLVPRYEAIRRHLSVSTLPRDGGDFLSPVRLTRERRSHFISLADTAWPAASMCKPMAGLSSISSESGSRHVN